MDWINKAQHEPTKAEADAQDCVLVWHKYSGCIVMRIDLVMKNRFVKYWMPLPTEPGKAK